MERISQTQAVLMYIQEKGSITTLDAFVELGVLRLASRINDLKRSGWKFETTTEKVTTRYGGKTRITRYRLGE